METDIIIIGGGPAGYTAAAYAAKHGRKVVVMEDHEVGGTCLNRGCIPTKCLAHSADIIRLGGVVSFTDAINHEKEVVSELRQRVEQMLQQPGITLVNGKAHFVDDHTVAVGEGTYTAHNILIATGSKPKMPRIDGIDSPKVVSSTGLLELSELPEKLAIVGAGVIGMELASAFSVFGCKVHVYEFLKECLPAIDKDIAKRVRKQMEKQGITFNMKYSVSSIDELDGDKVLIATGRMPNIDGLGLENTHIKLTPKGIATDDNFQTNVEGVFAIGDVNGRIQLAHAAEAQARRAVNNIVGIEDHIRFDIMPSAVFTNPEAASVGLSEDACKEKGIDCKVKKALYRANGRALSMGETDGLLKLVASSADGRILGCDVCGPHAAEMVQEVAAVMNLDGTVETLADTIHIHPTLSEILHDAAMQF